MDRIRTQQGGRVGPDNLAWPWRLGMSPRPQLHRRQATARNASRLSLRRAALLPALAGDAPSADRLRDELDVASDLSVGAGKFIAFDLQSPEQWDDFLPQNSLDVVADVFRWRAIGSVLPTATSSLVPHSSIVSPAARRLEVSLHAARVSPPPAALDQPGSFATDWFSVAF